MHLQDEMRSLRKEEGEEILKEASLPIEIPTELAITLKADLVMSWNNLCTVRR